MIEAIKEFASSVGMIVLIAFALGYILDVVNALIKKIKK